MVVLVLVVHIQLGMEMDTAMAQITLQSVAMMVATAAQVIAQMAHTIVQIHVQVVLIQIQQILLKVVSAM